MRVALCDDDGPLVALVESLVVASGHELIGVADTTVAAVHLVEHGHPDLVVVDPAVGCNTDFDVIETAAQVGATTVVFSRSADAVVSRHSGRPPIVVVKPDLVALEAVINRLGRDGEGGVSADERRAKPSREASGPPPTGIHDASAFYTAVNEAVPGDAFVAVSVAEGAARDAVAAKVNELIREGDRILVTGWSVVVFLVASGEHGVTAFSSRLDEVGLTGDEIRVTSTVVARDETGPDAMARLKSQA